MGPAPTYAFHSYVFLAFWSMTTRAEPVLAGTTARTMLNKVPQITVFFWVIKVLATTVGETAADFLNATLGLGLGGTSAVMGVLLAAALLWQFRTRRYVPGIYWVTVVLISVLGTLITDSLIDVVGVPLPVTTAVFAVALAITFAVWYSSERTLSIHSIVTTRREGFYWLAILFTFALGTAAGDLIAEQFALGYPLAVLLFAGAIAVVGLAYRFGANAVATFWIAYILTRPLGASMGDLLSQDRVDGGLGLGTVVTSIIFLVVIAILVTFLTRTRRDALDVPTNQI